MFTSINSHSHNLAETTFCLSHTHHYNSLISTILLIIFSSSFHHSNNSIPGAPQSQHLSLPRTRRMQQVARTSPVEFAPVGAGCRDVCNGKTHQNGHLILTYYIDHVTFFLIKKNPLIHIINCYPCSYHFFAFVRTKIPFSNR